MATYSIEKIQELLKKLTLIGADTEAIAEKGLARGLLLIEGTARKLTPTSPSGGNLKSSITHTVNKVSGGIEGIVGTNVHYAPYVEFGTGPVGQANKPELPPNLNIEYRQTGWVYYSVDKEQFFYTRGMAAQPFLYPAYKQHKNDVILVIQSTLSQELKKFSK